MRIITLDQCESCDWTYCFVVCDVWIPFVRLLLTLADSHPSAAPPLYCSPAEKEEEVLDTTLTVILSSGKEDEKQSAARRSQSKG